MAANKLGHIKMKHLLQPWVPDESGRLMPSKMREDGQCPEGLDYEGQRSMWYEAMPGIIQYSLYVGTAQPGKDSRKHKNTRGKTDDGSAKRPGVTDQQCRQPPVRQLSLIHI